MAAIKGAALLATTMALALAVLSVLYALLADDIRASQHEYETAQLHTLLTAVAPAATLPPPLTLAATLPTSNLQRLYPLYQDGKLVAAILQVWTASGYNGDISLLMAHRRNDEKMLLRVLQHRETPGITEFLNAAPEQAYDGVSGATISANTIRQTAAEVQTWVKDCMHWAARVGEPPLAPNCY